MPTIKYSQIEVFIYGVLQGLGQEVSYYVHCIGISNILHVIPTEVGIQRYRFLFSKKLPNHVKSLQKATNLMYRNFKVLELVQSATIEPKRLACFIRLE